MRPLPNPLRAILPFALLWMLAGCASIQSPLPPSLELPKPPTDLRAVRKGHRVYLYWTVPGQTMDRQRVRHPGPTRICRNIESPMKACGNPVGNLAAVALNPSGPKPEASFVDTLPAELEQQNPTRLVTYAVEAMNLHARSAGLSNQVQVPLVSTLPPPANFRAEIASKGVVLTWDCEIPPAEPHGVRYAYRIYRNSVDTRSEVKIADVACPDNRFEDQTIEWQKVYEYRISVVSTVELEPKVHPCTTQQTADSSTEIHCLDVANAEGDDSSVQRVFTKDIYPPAVPTGLQAVFSGPGQTAFIDLLWAPVSDVDLAGYNVYRHEDGGQSVKINADLVKAPTFRDTNVTAGKTYRYSVSAVDERGNESARSEETGESVPQP
jgi:fibronectin type 3 domain-containing protein